MDEYKSKADLLYEEVGLFQQNVEQIMSAEGVGASEIAEAVGFQKDSLKESMERCYKTMANYEHAADIIKGELAALDDRSKALKERMASFKKKANTLNEVMKIAMLAMDETSVFLPTVTIELKSGTAKVEIDDPDAVPDELRNEPKVPEPSKTLLKKYLEQHPECEFAHLEKTMEVKYKV